MRIAFYAPLKAPDHPVPSGDRTMARAIHAALELAGHEVVVASRLRAFSGVAEPARLASLRDAAAADVARLSRQPSPDLWFTYHLHYKAPDLIGPAAARAWGVPYVVAEASHAAKRAHGPWAPWQAEVEAALAAAVRVFCLTARDREGLARLGLAATLLDLPPFLARVPGPAPPRVPHGGPLRLVTVAMMREGDKAMSYAFLARALAQLRAPWSLHVVGDGPARTAIEALFAWAAPERVVWRGRLDPAEVEATLANADLFVWPGFGEAFGLAYLEAQAAGLPVVALDVAGVSSVVLDGRTGLLCPASESAFASAIEALAADAARRLELGRSGRRFVVGERDLAGAAARIEAGIADLVPVAA